jgi:DNA-binding NtrC family response regulator
VSRRILVVDDEKNIRVMLEQMLLLAGYEVECRESGEEAVAFCTREDADAVLLDVRLQGMDGLQCLHKLRELSPNLGVVMMSGHATIDLAIAAVRAGASDFLEKPLTRDKTLLTLRNALRTSELERENARLRAESFRETLLGDSPIMVALRQRIAQVAPTQARVLIRGESGTGKELIARALHQGSSRAARAFLALNCAAIPAELIESELFGHVRGAFTGATTARAGAFEMADQGTLFLDEIGDMPLPMQAKLLRVLESGELSRVGSSRVKRVDVRILAATHRDLLEAVRESQFREDLFHRLNVVPLTAPPLREHMEDLPLLAEHFLRQEVLRQKLSPRRFTSRALQRLGRARWPGNVRELRNMVERLAILSREESIGEEAVRGALGLEEEPQDLSLKAAVEEAERQAIQRALRGAGGNVSEAARRLGLERSHLYKKAHALGLRLSQP